MDSGIQEIKSEIADLSIEKALDKLTILFPEKVIFSTSFGYEDQLLTHLIATHNLPIEIFTLDTGRLFQETYSVFNSTLDRYKKKISVFCPNTNAVESLLTQKGPFSFYESIENRKECCFIRKVEPLKRALAGYSVWVTGIRSEQSVSRTDMEELEWDEGNKIIKYHPLLNWSFEQIKEYIHQHNIPYNALHDKGFVSIGCAPCTRAIKEGEDFRAGRWWWEDTSKKECGLHQST
jgi:phosphoadenosine phosphosulfate reductase